MAGKAGAENGFLFRKCRVEKFDDFAVQKGRLVNFVRCAWWQLLGNGRFKNKFMVRILKIIRKVWSFFLRIPSLKSHPKVTRNQLRLPSNSNKSASKCSRRFIGLQASHRYFTIPSSAVSLNASSTLHIVNFSVWQNFCLHCSIMHVCNYYYPTHINNNSNEWPIASIEVQTEPEQKLSPWVDKEINLSMNSSARFGSYVTKKIE